MGKTLSKTQKYNVLACRVLAVLSITWTKEPDEADTTKEVFDWSAYIDAVPGMNHDEEWVAVWKRGSKLSPEVAVAVFPEMEDHIKKYRR